MAETVLRQRVHGGFVDVIYHQWGGSEPWSLKAIERTIAALTLMRANFIEDAEGPALKEAAAEHEPEPAPLAPPLSAEFAKAAARSAIALSKAGG